MKLSLGGTPKIMSFENNRICLISLLLFNSKLAEFCFISNLAGTSPMHLRAPVFPRLPLFLTFQKQVKASFCSVAATKQIVILILQCFSNKFWLHVLARILCDNNS